jgi:hypothetical protein
VAARGGGGGGGAIAPGRQREGALKEGGKKIFHGGTSEEGDRGVARVFSYLIHGLREPNQKKKKRSLDGCPPGGATNTTFAPGRQKPSRRH